MEYYLYYCTEQATQEKNYEMATLIKTDGSFYYYDEDSDDWKTEVFYDASFTKDWRSKSERVKAISYDEALAIISDYHARKSEEYTKRLNYLKDFIYCEKYLGSLFKSMTYAYASLTDLWGEVFNEEEYITDAIQYKFKERTSTFCSRRRYFSEPHKITLDKETEYYPNLVFDYNYDSAYDKKKIWCEGGVFYNGHYISDREFSIVLKIVKYEVRKDKYDGVLRAYPIETVGCWTLIYE
ncbi:MAG: hypothetical protein IKC64_05465 [Clostridia bacterium]|nr:hypothetical protein [Clostridia bacterium]